MKSLATANPLRRIRLAWSVGGGIVVLLLTLAWWMLLACPAFDACDAMIHELDSVVSLADSKQEIHARLSQVTSEAQSWERIDETLRSRSDFQDDEAGFLKWVNSHSIASGLTLRDFRPGDERIQGDYESRSISLSFQGPYDGICRFLDRLRSCPRMNRAISLEVTPRDSDGTSFTFNLQVILLARSHSKLTANKGG